MESEGRSAPLPRPVRINVGGVEFCTTVETLRSAPGSALADPSVIAAVASGDIPFFDRDPDAFGYVLSFLRSGRAVLPRGDHDSGRTRTRLLAEAKFFGLPSLEAALGEIRPQGRERQQNPDVKPSSTYVYLSFERVLMFSEENIIGGYHIVNGKMSHVERGGWFRGFSLQELQDSFRAEVARVLEKHRSLGYAVTSCDTSQSSLPVREVDKSAERTGYDQQQVLIITIVMERTLPPVDQ